MSEEIKEYPVDNEIVCNVFEQAFQDIDRMIEDTEILKEYWSKAVMCLIRQKK